MFSNFLFDFKHAYRLWTKAPGYFFVCTAVVALSVGLALWASVLAYTMTLKPLPFPGSERWMNIQVARTATSASKPEIDQYTYQEVIKSASLADHLGAYTASKAILGSDHATSMLRAAEISPKLLATTKVVPLLGRLFDVGDGQREAAPIAILSFLTWKNHFAGDPGIIGKQARFNGKSVQIVGVMPENFFAFSDFEVWFPLRLEQLTGPDAAKAGVTAFIILKDGQTVNTLLPEMKQVVDTVNQNYIKKFTSGRNIRLVPANRMFTIGFTPVVTMISLIALAVLLLGGVNVSLVFYARLLERSRELALRIALGSSRWRMLRQCLLESSLVMIPGLLLGVLLTIQGVSWTQGISTYTAQYLASGRDGNMLVVRPMDWLIALLIAALLWLISTLVPSWRLAKQDPSISLGGSGKGTTQSGSAKSASIIVGFQVFISSLILVICMNLMTAIREETSKPTGINSTNVMLSTDPTVLGARYADASSRVQYLSGLTAAIKKRLPGTEVAYTTAVPTRAPLQSVAIEGRENSADQGTLKLPVTAVSNNYFTLLDIRLRSGRFFDDSDIETSLNVAVIDEVTANRYWPGQDAKGKRIQLNPNESGSWLTVIGVVSAVGHEPYNDRPGVVYRPMRQANADGFLLLAKLTALAPQNRTALQEAIYSTDQDLSLHNLQYINDYLSALDVAFSALVPAFAVIALITMILAGSGLFGLISRFVVRRTQEIGIRRALGSSPARIMWLFLGQGAVYLVVGVIGGSVGLFIANLLSSSIPNILSHAALVMPGVFLLIAGVIFIATYLPTRHAVALEPADALRYD